MEKKYLSMTGVHGRILSLARRIISYKDKELFGDVYVYGIPRGGVTVVFALMEHIAKYDIYITDDVTKAQILVDDIIVTGKTVERLKAENPNILYADALIPQSEAQASKLWYVFPWEVSLGGEDSSANDIVTRMLEYIGEDCSRDGLIDTPKRVLSAWGELYAGYKQNPADILGKRFENEENYDQMVLLDNIEFYSNCEHHLLPFFGKVHIAYIPDGKVVGISKLSRLVDCFSKRAQIQERMTQQIANAIQEHLAPKGVAVIVEAQHFCMTARGVRKQNAIMTTSAIKGCFTQNETRMEFLSLIKRGK